MRTALMILWACFVFAALGSLVWQKEQTFAHGRTVLLKLAPRDPRSLMQGDYMALRYDLVREVKLEKLPGKGRLILKLDGHNVATFVRVDDGTPLAADETRIAYRNRNGLLIGAESFFFQEGDAQIYGGARFGELKVDAAGNTILLGLRGEKLEPLGKAWR